MPDWDAGVPEEESLCPLLLLDEAGNELLAEGDGTLFEGLDDDELEELEELDDCELDDEGKLGDELDWL